LQNAANAQAGGIVGATNALVGGQNAFAQALGSAPMAFMQASMMQNYLGGGGSQYGASVPGSFGGLGAAVSGAVGPYG
jgi:hypothetical protein